MRPQTSRIGPLGRSPDVTVQPFESVVVEHGPVVWRVCRALLGPADADDAWSETFLAALRAYPDLSEDSNVRGWLVTIAHRKAIDQIRRTSRGARPAADLPEQPSPEGIPEPADQALRVALEALPPKQRGAVIYHHLAGLTYAEVGVLLGTSEVAARRSGADGIANLRKTYLEGARR
jgi:RNA polymerase sigma factor (sigma-70 family)